MIGKRLGLSALAAILVGGAYVVAQGEGGWAVPGVFAISMVTTSTYSTFCAVFRSSGHAGIEGINEVASKHTCVLVVGWFALSQGAGLLGIVTVYTVVDMLSLGALGLAFDRLTPRCPHPIDHDRLALRRAKCSAGAGIVTTLYFHVDTWLVALIKGPRVVGQYAAAYRCFDALLIPATTVGALSIPHTSGLEGRALQHHLWRLARLSLLFTAPPRDRGHRGRQAAAVTVVFEPKYDGATTTLRILACGAFLAAIVMVVLPARAPLRSSGSALSCSLVTNVALNLVFIPPLRCRGAATVTVLCELVLAVFLGNEVRRLTAVRRSRTRVQRSEGGRVRT